MIIPVPSAPLNGARLKIAVIGPVASFRGGIAQHTIRLANALAEIAKVCVVSISRLYPRWLYPGKFQAEHSRLRLGSMSRLMRDAVKLLSWRRTAAHIEA